MEGKSPGTTTRTSKMFGWMKDKGMNNPLIYFIISVPLSYIGVQFARSEEPEKEGKVYQEEKKPIPAQDTLPAQKKFHLDPRATIPSTTEEQKEAATVSEKTNTSPAALPRVDYAVAATGNDQASNHMAGLISQWLQQRKPGASITTPAVMNRKQFVQHFREFSDTEYQEVTNRFPSKYICIMESQVNLKPDKYYTSLWLVTGNYHLSIYETISRSLIFNNEKQFRTNWVNDEIPQLMMDSLYFDYLTKEISL